MSVCRRKLSVKYAKYSPSFLADGLDVWQPTKIVRKSYSQVLFDLVNYFKRMTFKVVVGNTVCFLLVSNIHFDALNVIRLLSAHSEMLLISPCSCK